MPKDSLQIAIERLNDTIVQLGQTLAGLERAAQMQARATELRLADLDDRLRKTATESRLAEFRGELLRETKVINGKLDLLLQAAK